MTPLGDHERRGKRGGVFIPDPAYADEIAHLLTNPPEGGQKYRRVDACNFVLSDSPFAPGEHERKGDGGWEGCCAACRQYVGPNDASVIRYHPIDLGGIFHQRCDPTSDDETGEWYSIEGEAPDL